MTELPAELETLLAAARGGDRDALGAALDGCRQYLLGVANRQLDPGLRAKGGASDVVQQTFLEAQRDFARFQGGSVDELHAWLKHLLLNNAADFARGFTGTDKRDPAREVGLPGGSTSDGGGLAGETPTASANLMAEEQAERVRRALATLPEDYRRVIVWRYQEEQSFADIAQRLGRSENAARKLWFRAVALLEQELGGSIDGR